MADLVSPDDIERIVGARRHPTAHLGRAVSSEQVVYILHSESCRATADDIRQCGFSRALDNGIDPTDWAGVEDQAVVLKYDHGLLMPNPGWPTDVELLDHAALVDDARAARDEGMETAENAADPRLILIIDAAIAAANASGDPWSANDSRVHAQAARDEVTGNWLRMMVRVGSTPSTLHSTHAKDVALWQGAHVHQLEGCPS